MSLLTYHCWPPKTRSSKTENSDESFNGWCTLLLVRRKDMSERLLHFPPVWPAIRAAIPSCWQYANLSECCTCFLPGSWDWLRSTIQIWLFAARNYPDNSLLQEILLVICRERLSRFLWWNQRRSHPTRLAFWSILRTSLGPTSMLSTLKRSQEGNLPSPLPHRVIVRQCSFLYLLVEGKLSSNNVLLKESQGLWERQQPQKALLT